MTEEIPDFRVVVADGGDGITYTCGCPCQPIARPGSDGTPGFEHCCCGKAHFVGTGARSALDAYVAERRTRRTNEPDYAIGDTIVAIGESHVEVAWAFPAR